MSRRKAGFTEKATIALLGGALLCLWLHLPALVPELGLEYRPSPAATPFLPWGRAFSCLGEGLALSAVLLAYQLALGRFGISRLRLTRLLFGAVAGVVTVAALASLMLALEVRAVFVPLSLAALWVSASFGIGAGLLTVLTSIACYALMEGSGVFMTPLVVRAVVVVMFFRDGKSAFDGLRAGFFAGLVSGIVAAAPHLGTSGWLEALTAGGWAAAGGFAEGALFYLTRGAGQRLLGHISREHLVALLDLSQPLLQRMIQRAPGSFEHSRAMANLAEQAASAIGADALLTRVGAYYHDLGKSVEPKFFVENVEPGETSPHDELPPDQSVQHILRHVSAGVQILREGGIPEPVVEFAYTHHGTQVVEYFLNKQRALVGEDAVDPADFRYPGMKPGTLETAILMLVDSIEAASRTIDVPDRARFEDLVRRIVFAKLAAEQLDESGMTMQQLRIVCDRVVETLVHMNHHRIKYPWQEERARQFGIGQQELSPLAKRTKLSAISLLG